VKKIKYIMKNKFISIYTSFWGRKFPYSRRHQFFIQFLTKRYPQSNHLYLYRHCLVLKFNIFQVIFSFKYIINTYIQVFQLYTNLRGLILLFLQSLSHYSLFLDCRAVLFYLGFLFTLIWPFIYFEIDDFNLFLQS
jgi:hypothetical protein